ncbi:MAG: NAD-dependent protein deacylase [Natronomonas sp.]
MDERIEQLASNIRDASRTVAFTGAGVSTASGIPDFRGKGGIWETHDPDAFNLFAFQRDPGVFWEAMVGIYDDAFPGDAEPNAAHQALATLESVGHLEAIITQNADRLHQEAGSQDVIELHGTLKEVVCRSCSFKGSMDDAIGRARAGELPPTCPECEGVLKPDGILFGEQLPEYALFRAHALAEKSDIFIVAGSSLAVEPAASLPETAAKRGATLAIVNFDPTPHDDVADFVFQEDVTTVLPLLAEALV